MDISIDITGWTQQEINLIHSASVSLLASESITYDTISFSDSFIKIINPSSDPSSILNSSSLRLKTNFIIKSSTDAMLSDIDYQNRKILEIKNNSVTNLKISNIDSSIDSLSSINDLKTFLKELVRYIKAKEN